MASSNLQGTRPRMQTREAAHPHCPRRHRHCHPASSAPRTSRSRSMPGPCRNPDRAEHEPPVQPILRSSGVDGHG
uniref:Uncharacterized protein n=1 Tax=Oryza glumipatula TaxID=40148 RepID=A0A0D9YRH8_9ORYZ